ncbi:hypothetical protein NVP1072O_48 [Vibrio phage 1.072.O._10N.286.48.A12]|nr:hypothetical protein NVP1004O_47 [Vibrio phage 1.004.O._10N.261.54.A2]AUR83607.1 hypothetical protein NVP1037O_47 [Vibrio phage 1.037.O._10N.261.52.F7]AUR84492.1 hypothetical protein NVP1056O_50 [Vibrio phage 1.056.O._10N.261.48.C11]AUR85009.1 hypothetical protein NVP1066O_50 [Vibrio phage 1.066.O._10N.286.46.E8]AUR85140.1 hypothetical protein NVP1068O_50 [Vibrio phage 1.068.O._10N.261.51.F8]AUR85365.1 hypothetical protein NVP1072O_48 [Vibrio phage 1.072.O._10N.286.48.A12]
MANYIVLTEDSVSEIFNEHSKAFNHCEGLKPRLCKAVYLMIDDKTLGALNVFGGWESQHTMQTIHRNQFEFRVI